MKIIVVLFLFFFPLSSYSFSLETHVWIGQQVVNDLLEQGAGYGKVTIPPFGEYEVDSTIVKAIEANRKVYLMGNIGPDAFPDLIAGQATTHAGMENGWKTDDWLAHVLSMGEADKEVAFKYGYVAHGAADFWAHTYVNAYSGGHFDIHDGEVHTEMRHILLERLIAEYTPPLLDHNDVYLGEYHANVAVGSALPLDAMFNSLLNSKSVQEEYAKLTSTAYLTEFGAIENKVSSYISRVESLRTPVDQAIGEVSSQIIKIEAEIDDILSNPTLNYGLVCELECTQKDEVCEEWSIILFGFGPCLSYDTVCVAVEKVCTENNTIGELRKSLAPLRDYQYLIMSARPEIEFIYQALLDWREGIRVAAVEYQGMSSRVAVELLKANGNPTQELKDWVACHGLTLTGFNTFFVGTTSVTWEAECKLYKTYSEVVKSIDFVLEYYSEVLYGVLGSELNDLKNQIESDFQRYVGEALLSAVAGVEVLELIESYKAAKNGDVSGLLTASFSSLDNRELLIIEDIVSRVKSEMYLKNGRFDPERYAVAYNSVVLAKLSLLSSAELNRMVADSGGHSGLYGQELYGSDYPFNIMLGGVKSLDHGYQWLAVAPPQLRRNGWVYLNGQNTSYSSEEGKGFRLFQDPATRDGVFRKIFKGALVPGIELPSQINHPDVKPDGYPYRVCGSNYYPNGLQDNGLCSLEYLIPAFSILHNRGH